VTTAVDVSRPTDAVITTFEVLTLYQTYNKRDLRRQYSRYVGGEMRVCGGVAVCSGAVVGHGRHRALRVDVAQLQTVVGRHLLLRHRQPSVAVLRRQPRDRRRVLLRMRPGYARLLPVRQPVRLAIHESFNLLLA